jgi:hypothetical protein
MAGSIPVVKGVKVRPHRSWLLIALYFFGALLIYSNIAVCIITFQEGLNIKYISLALWPPFTIAFTGVLWSFLATERNGERTWMPISLIGLGGAAILLIIFGAVPYTGNADWGAFLVPSVTLLSIAGVSLSWRALDSIKSSRYGPMPYLGVICVLLILSFLLAWAFFYYLIELIPMTIASAIIWGWVYDPTRPKLGSRRKEAGLRIGIFFVTYLFIPFLVYFVPYLFWWYFI